jgi:hypothetical protein
MTNPLFELLKSKKATEPKVLLLLKETKRIFEKGKYRTISLAEECDRLGRLPLHYALIHHASFEVVRALVYAYPNSARLKDRYGDLKLHTAVRRRCTLETIQCLCVHHAEGLSQIDSQGLLPLHIALLNKSSVPISNYLLKCFPAAACSLMTGGWSPFQYALKNLVGYLPTSAFLAMLMTDELTVTAKETTRVASRNHQPDPEGILPVIRILMQTPRWKNAREQNEVLQALLSIMDREEVMEVVEKDFGQRSILHFACLYKCPAVCVFSVLQYAPKSVMETDRDGRLPLHVALQRGVPTESLCMIIDAYPSACNMICGLTSLLPIELAARHNSPSTVQDSLLHCRSSSDVAHLLSLPHAAFLKNEHEKFAKELGHPGVRFEAGARCDFSRNVADQVIRKDNALEAFRNYLHSWNRHIIENDEQIKKEKTTKLAEDRRMLEISEELDRRVEEEGRNLRETIFKELEEENRQDIQREFVELIEKRETPSSGSKRRDMK